MAVMTMIAQRCRCTWGDCNAAQQIIADTAIRQTLYARRHSCTRAGNNRRGLSLLRWVAWARGWRLCDDFLYLCG
jgi:hypothetical protein